MKLLLKTFFPSLILGSFNNYKFALKIINRLFICIAAKKSDMRERWNYCWIAIKLIF